MKRKITGVLLVAVLFFAAGSYANGLVKLGLLVDRKGEQLEVKSLTFGALKELCGLKGETEVRIPFYFVDYLEVEGYNTSTLLVESVVHFRDGSSSRVALRNQYFHGKSTLGTFVILARDVSEVHFPD